VNEKNKELAVNTLQLTQKELLLNDLQIKLKKLSPNSGNENKIEINKLIQTINFQQKDTFWREFDVYFEQLHNGFFNRLSDKYPGLSPSEKRLCAFVKVGLTSKEIASITQKNYKSIEVLRVRLRKKIGIEKDENLSDFLNKL